MLEKPVAEKLQIKEGQRVLLVNAPRGYKTLLGKLPKGAKLLKAATEPADVIQVFVADRKELEEQLPKLKNVLAPDGMLWVMYHKRTSRIRTDINRDSINAYADSTGLQGVAMISIDDDWAALRLKVA